MNLLRLSLILSALLLNILAQSGRYDEAYEQYLAKMKQYQANIEAQKKAQQIKQLHALQESLGVEKTDFNPKPSLQSMCKRYAPSVHLHCKGASTGKHAQRCFKYFEDCLPVIPREDSLYTLAQIYKELPEPSEQEGFISQESTPSVSSNNPRLDASCRRLMSTARVHCHGKNTKKALASSCNSFLSSCSHLIPSSHPLYNLAQQASTQWATREDNGIPAEDLPPRAAEVLKKACDHFLPTVEKHCKGDVTSAKYSQRCKAYFQDCHQFLTQSSPVYDIGHGFTSGVGLNLGTWGVKGIPFYPVNEEGAIGAGYLMNIPFGAWGGGYSDHFGVRDYWSQYHEVGANWWEGKYGYKSGWSVPLVQSLGIEGDTHAVVSVPLKPGDFGKPIGVDVGGGVGPYYQQNQHVGVDWVDGQVSENFGVGVPIAGVGVNTGVGVAFPGASTWLG